MGIKVLVMKNQEITCTGTYTVVYNAILHMCRDLYDDYNGCIRQAGLFSSQNDLIYPFPESQWVYAKARNLSAIEFADLVTSDTEKMNQLEKFAVSLRINIASRKLV